MATEVECIIYFPEGSEAPDREELEDIIRKRYDDAIITEYEEEDV